jgi:hypothetical protein
MTLRSAWVVAGVLALAGSLVAQGSVRRDGRWEVKMEMQMAAMTMPPQTLTQCVTKEEAADPQKGLPQTGRGASPSDCKVSDYKVVGNKVTWSMACEKEKMSGTGEFVYAGDTYTGTMKMNAQGQEMTMKYSGKRLGDCTK